jgi:membrane protein YqaA with SNARE-associated domain
MPGSTETTVTVAAAGTAAGGVVAWALGLALGHPVPTEVAVGLGLLGCFTFGRLFPLR